ncbi:glycosyltransferase family 25 protein [Acinetobacter baumannii]|nr:glycosyltransferase family 25 protein [Acinetobacter baumannii]
MKVLMINLDGSKDRLQQQNEQFDKLKVVFERLPAVSIADFSKGDYQKLAFNGQRPMKQSELACFLSHKKAWEYIVTLNEPCVVLEDDAVLVREFKQIIKAVTNLENIDFINLEVHGRRKLIAKSATFDLTDDHFRLFSLYQDRSGTGGYILYPSGAKKLLDFMEKRAIGLADEFIYSCRSLEAYQIEPAVLLQSDKCEMYGVKPMDDMHSIIGQVKNTISFELSIIEKIQFKYRRIIAQIILGYYYLLFMCKGAVKREIKVEPKRFD